MFLLAAFGGGVFGAAIGGQPAFIFTGFMVMIGVANSLAGGGFDFLGNVAFGPVFGPHISFAGGAAAAFAARLMFSSTGLFGIMEDEDRERGRLVPGGAHVWVEHQQNLLQSTMIGLGAGLLSGYVVATFTEASADFAAGAGILMFGVSAVSLILLQFGLPGPVTHHMSLPAAVAAAGALSLGLGGGAALVAGAVGGVLGALLGEFYSRLFLIHGDTHVDPPAFAIFTMATVVVVIRLLGGGV